MKFTKGKIHSSRFLQVLIVVVRRWNSLDFFMGNVGGSGFSDLLVKGSVRDF